MRLRWWLEPGATFRAAALISKEVRQILPEIPVSESMLFGRQDGPPLFFGHYWMQGEPILMSPRAVCVDWSIAAGGVLAAYRFDGEPTLSAERFVTAT